MRRIKSKHWLDSKLLIRITVNAVKVFTGREAVLCSIHFPKRRPRVQILVPLRNRQCMTLRSYNKGFNLVQPYFCVDTAPIGEIIASRSTVNIVS